MTYLISRANYRRCTEGMTDAQRADFDRDFMQYPERLDSPDGRIDLDRVADRYADLRARETGMPPLLTFEYVRERIPFAGWALTTTTEMYETAAWLCPKGNGKSSWRPSDPWSEIGDGVYVAPPGTPMPSLFTPDPGPAPTIAEQAAEQWAPWWTWKDCGRTDDLIGADTLTGGWLNHSPRREWLNDWVGERQPTRNPIEDMLAWWREYKQLAKPLRPQRVATGEIARLAILFAGRATKLTASAGVVVDLAGIPIVADPDLPGDVWQLVDVETNNVLYEGIIPPGLVRMIREIRETAADLVDELAERADTPRDLLWPPASDA